MALKFIDLFAGIGGFRIALDGLGAKCVYSSDNDKYVQDVYEENFGERPDGDITQVISQDIPSHDILCGGFPCQPFSIGGFRKGFADTRGTLFFDVERILREKKPRAFILENVRGLVNHDGGRTFNTIIEKLAKTINGQENLFPTKDNLGYNVFYKVLNSKDYNIPQNRERIFIVGFLEDNVGFEFPKPVPLTKTLESILDKNVKNHDISEKALYNIENHIKNKSGLDYKKPILAYEIRKSRVAFRNNNTSPCLTAKMGTGGNNVPVLVQKKRKLTVEECLRIQGFPKNFKMKSNNSQSYKQIGNSVSVPLVKKVAREVLKSLGTI
jgi:DNA (cytosine-5)-methyltransferase 1